MLHTYDPATQNILPPDFQHGIFPVDTVYNVFGEHWVNNALFIVQSNGETFWAAFDDYFLCFGRREIADQFENRSSQVVLNLDPTTSIEGTVNIRCSRERFQELETQTLGVSREGDDASVDLLSFVCLCGALGFDEIQ